MDHVIDFGVRGISKSIAVASEAFAAQRDKSKNKNRSDGVEVQTSGLRAGRHPSARSDDSDSDNEEHSIDREWQIDEALSTVAVEDDALTQDPRSYTSQRAYVADNQRGATDQAFQPKPLPQTIILPQRRPGTRSRGFIRAYAPILQECSGISQDTFLNFLNEFDKASKTSPVFDVINIACFGLGLVPSSICIAISTSVGVANGVAKELQGRYRTNKFLDEVNETLFKPRRLYCMVMTYRPDMPGEAFLRADVSVEGNDAHDVALQKIMGREDSVLRQKLARLRPSSGKVMESQLPDLAPLIYPALDRAIEEAASGAQLEANSNSTSTEVAQQQQPSTGSALQTTQTAGKVTPLGGLSALANNAAVQDYLDRRAQADFAGKNPNSKLAIALPPQEKKYVNRFADPNHPINSGSLFGLLSGGTFDPIANGRVRRAERHARKKNQPALTEAERHDAYMGRIVRSRVTGTPSKKMPVLGKILKRDLLYLVVVNLPGEEDLNMAMKMLQ